jgi:hypothetical protein
MKSSGIGILIVELLLNFGGVTHCFAPSRVSAPSGGDSA